MALVRHRVGIAAARAEVFECLIDPARLTGWWASTAQCDVKVGGRVELGFTGLTTLRFEICELDPPASLRLRCLGAPEAWTDTCLEFNTEPAPNQTFLYLTHSKPEADDLDFLFFNTKWPLFLVSLKELLETGSGRPFPNDIRIQHD